MAYETSALRGDLQQDLVAEDDYQSFSAALSASARGRAFLAEYARRNRHADTAVVLAALDRLEAVARSQKAAPEAERIRQDLRALLDTLQSAKPQIELSPGAIKAATLSALLEFVQARIESLVGPAAAPGVRHFLAPVPQSDEPELPIPRPGASAQPSIALVQTITPPVDADTTAGPTIDPMVLSLDPRVGPIFGEPTADAPRPANVIPQIDFVGPVFEPTEAKAAPAATVEEPAVLTLSPPAVAASHEIAMAPPPSAAVLPPLELTSTELVAPVAAQPPQATADIHSDAETTARADALVRATNATADAIDNIVAAAAALMAEAAAAEAATAETAGTETAIADLAPADAVIADRPIADTAIADMAIADMAIAGMAIIEMAIVETTVAETPGVETISAETISAEAQFAEIAFADAAPAEIAPVEANLPEIGFIETGSAATGSTEAELTQIQATETNFVATFEPPAVPAASQTQNTAITVQQVAVAGPSPRIHDDALAAIMAMSEEERLALFT